MKIEIELSKETYKRLKMYALPAGNKLYDEIFESILNGKIIYDEPEWDGSIGVEGY